MEVGSNAPQIPASDSKRETVNLPEARTRNQIQPEHRPSGEKENDVQVDRKINKNCHICGQTITSVKSLMAHYIELHFKDEMKSYHETFFKSNAGKCEFCLKVETTFDDYVTHVGIDHKQILNHLPQPIRDKIESLLKPMRTPAQICYLCNAPMFTSKMYKLHLLHEHFYKDLEEKYKVNEDICKECKTMFQTTKEYLVHLVCKHDKIQEFIPESEKDKLVSKQPNTPKSSVRGRKIKKKGRRFTSGTVGKKIFQCPTCQRFSENSSQFLQHQTLEHYKEEIKEMCEGEFKAKDGFCAICQKYKIETLERYIQHLGCRHEMVKRFLPPEVAEKISVKKMIRVADRSLLICHYCSKQLTGPSVLKTHMYMHFVKEIHQKYPYQKKCPICDKDSISLNGFYSHLCGAHNKIQEFVNDDVLKQLKMLNSGESLSDSKAITNSTSAEEPANDDKDESTATAKRSTRTKARLDYSFDSSSETQVQEKCHFCNYQLVDPENYRKHLVTHYFDKINSKYGQHNSTCPVCSSSFKNSMSLYYHLAVSHDVINEFASSQVLEQLAKFTLPDQPLHLLSRSGQQEEEETQLSSDRNNELSNKMVDCPKCDSCNGVAMSQLKRHLVTHYLERFKEEYDHVGLTCPYCSMEHTISGNFYRHLASIHDVVLKYLKEESVTILSSGESSNLKESIEETSQENVPKQFICPYCQVEKISYSNLKQHMVVHFKQEFVDKYGNCGAKCPECFKDKTNNALLKQHLAAFHNKIFDFMDQNTIQLFENKYGKVSQGERRGIKRKRNDLAPKKFDVTKRESSSENFVCPYCDKVSKTYFILKVHLISHFRSDFVSKYGNCQGKCPECPKEVPSHQNESILAHLAGYHNKIFDFMEPENAKILKSRFKNFHRGQAKIVNSDISSHNSNKVQILENDKNVAESDFNKKFICPYCDHDLPSYFSLKGHIIKHIRTGFLSKYGDCQGKCPICSKEFPLTAAGNGTLQRHIGALHNKIFDFMDPKNAQILKSRYGHCKRGVKRGTRKQKSTVETISGGAITAQSTSNDSNSTAITCLHCKKFMTSYKTLKIHLISHLSKKYHDKFADCNGICSECGNDYKTKQRLFEHACLVHNMSFKLESPEGKNHMVAIKKMQVMKKMEKLDNKSDHGKDMKKNELVIKIEAKSPDDALRDCQICSKTFSTSDMMKRHLVTHFLDAFRDKYANSNNMCAICDLDFPNEVTLFQHLAATHDKIFNFVNEDITKQLQELDNFVVPSYLRAKNASNSSDGGGGTLKTPSKDIKLISPVVVTLEEMDLPEKHFSSPKTETDTSQKASFETSSSLQRTSIEATTALPKASTEAANSSSLETSLSETATSHRSSTPTSQYKCYVCQKYFGFVSVLKRHLVLHFLERIKEDYGACTESRECPFCETVLDKGPLVTFFQHIGAKHGRIADYIDDEDTKNLLNSK